MALPSLQFKILLLQIMLHIGQTDQYCSKQFVGGEWIYHGDCMSQQEVADIFRDIEERAKEEMRKKEETAMPEIHSGPVSDSCKDDNSTGGCFWIEMPGKGTIDFANATQICENHSAVLAVIPNEAVYDDIVRAVQDKLSWNAVEVWLGIEIVQNTGAILHPGETYVKWHPNFATAPHGGSNQDARAIVLRVDSSGIGLGYTNPQLRRGGVVCWKPKNT